MKNTKKAPNIHIVLALWSRFFASEVISWAKTTLYPARTPAANNPATVTGNNLRNIVISSMDFPHPRSYLLRKDCRIVTAMLPICKTDVTWNTKREGGSLSRPLRDLDPCEDVPMWTPRND